MLRIKRFEFNRLWTNCYVVSDDTGECVIIDPCAQSRYDRAIFRNYIRDEKLKPVRCLLTHAHWDHLLSCFQVRDEYGLLPEVHHRDKLWMDRMESRIEEVFGPGMFKHDIVMPEHYLEDNEVISFGEHELVTLHTPGHSPGSVVYYCAQEKQAFTGDTLFKCDIGRSDLLFGWIQDLMESLELLVRQLPDDCTIWPGHDMESTIGYEKANNPFIKKYIATGN